MNYDKTKAAVNSDDILSSMDALLKRSENILDAIQNAKNQSDNHETLESLDALEQRAEKLHGEIQNQNTIAGQADPSLMTEGEIDTFINNLNLYVDSFSPRKDKRPAVPAANNPAAGYVPVVANVRESGGRLPAFPDVSIFDPPKEIEETPKSGLQTIKKKRLPKQLFKLPHLALYGFILVLIAFSVLVSINQVSETPLFGCRFYNVISNSMDGMINKGSLVLVKNIPYGDLAVGDIITYKTNQVNSEPITHQIVAVVGEQDDEKSFITKGYNNSVNDPSPVQPEMVLGKAIFHVPIVGAVLNFISKCIFLIIVILLVGAAAYLLFFVPNREKETKPGTEDEREEHKQKKEHKEHVEIDRKPAIPDKPVHDLSAAASAAPANKAESVHNILKNLQGILFVDSKKELEEKVEKLLESRNERIYSDLNNAVVKIGHDQSDILKELDGLISR